MKDPAVLFYTADFVTGTITMTDAQRGQYILLLCLQHQKGYLTEKDMLKICSTYDEDIWAKFQHEDGKFFNVRMKREADKRAAYSESRRNNRQKNGSDVQNNNHIKIDKKNISSSYDPHMENINININRDIDEDGVVVLKQPKISKKELIERAVQHYRDLWKQAQKEAPELTDWVEAIAKAIQEEPFDRIAKMSDHVRVSDLQRWSKDKRVKDVIETMRAMENYKQLGKYKSMRLTLNGWLNK